MLGCGRVVRITVLGVRVQEPRCYSVHVSASSEHSPAYEGSCGRTETAHLCVNPEFLNNSFLIRLPKPMGTSLKPQTLLTCQLWATPSVERGVAHIAADGRISDELVGEGVVHVIGEAASRMLRGQRVHVSAKLSTSTTLYPAAVATPVAAANKGARSPEVLLELMLIDTVISLPNDSLLAARPLASSQIAPDHVHAALPGSSECALFILVSSVQGLPMLPAATAAAPTVAAQPDSASAAAKLRAPSTFVAVKAARDIANGSAVQGATRVVGEHCNPVWQEVLVVRFVEQELQQERLVFAIMDDISARPISTCSVPLANIQAGFFYNLAVPAKTASEDAVLRVTLCLSAAPCQEVSRWRAFQDKSLGTVNVRVAACTADFTLPLKASESSSESEEAASVVARFDFTTQKDPKAAIQVAEDDKTITVYTDLKGEPKEDTEILANVTQSMSALGSAVFPLVGANRGTELLWPVSRMAVLAIPAGSKADLGLKVSLYGCNAAGNGTCLGCSLLQVQNLPEAGDGSLVPFSDLPFHGQEEECTLSLEVCHWSSSAYMDMLNAAAPMGVDMNEWTVPPDPLLGAPVVTSAHSPGLPNLFQCLVDDSIQKQAALEHVQRAADHAAQRCEISSWRLRDLDGRNRALSGDVISLRKMLHESKDGAISAAEVEQLSQLNARQLVERCRAYAARAQMERTRCAELLKRLKDMHAHDVGSRRLSAHMGELQRAHVQQNKVIQELEEGLARMPLLKSTVRKQEQVIVGLENLLRKTVQQVKCMRDSEESVRRERVNVEERLVEANKRAADAERRAHRSDGATAEYQARLQSVQAAQAQERQQQPEPQQHSLQPSHVQELPQPQPVQQPTQLQQERDSRNPSARNERAAELEQQLRWEQNECESVRRQLQADQAEKELLRRQQDDAGRESEALRRKVSELQEQMAVLRQQAAAAASEAAGLKLRVDASDAAAEAADSDLAQATAMYAREIAQMKARLVEKDAELLGGFGHPGKLADTQWSMPPMTPLKINPRPDAAFLERHFGFESYEGAQPQKPARHYRAGSHEAAKTRSLERVEPEDKEESRSIVKSDRMTDSKRSVDSVSRSAVKQLSGASTPVATSMEAAALPFETSNESDGVPQPSEEPSKPRTQSSDEGSQSSSDSSSSGESESGSSSGNSSDKAS